MNSEEGVEGELACLWIRVSQGKAPHKIKISE